jgi:hypothetical protein
MTPHTPSDAQWLARARGVAHYADLFWRSSREPIKHLKESSPSVAESPDLKWVEQHWPQRNKFEQSMFVSIAAMLATDVFPETDLVTHAQERFPLILHIHVTAMSDDDLVDWCADDLERVITPGESPDRTDMERLFIADLERMITADDSSDRTNMERLFIAWCETLLAQMLAYVMDH